jgi:DNA topoisomerase IB
MKHSTGPSAWPPSSASKDFRTWNATVLAAVGLAVSNHAGSATARQRAVARVVKEVAGYLGNTPAVARASYIDPRVVERYEEGDTIDRVLSDLGASTEFGELATQGEAEAAVLRLLARANREPDREPGCAAHSPELP